MEIDPGLSSLLGEAWKVSRSIHGNRLTVHVPGMFVVDGRRGRYRAVSITGDNCQLNCEHCKGTLLKTMPHALDPRDLVRLGLEAEARGDHGLLVSGGCDIEGRLPWKQFAPAIGFLKSSTGLTITVHTGLVDRETCSILKESGVDQALIDVIGDEATAREVYHLDNGISSIRRSLESLAAVGLETVPHILFGLHYGREKGETAALKILSEFPLKKYVVVALMPTRGTAMADVTPPEPLKVAQFIARARLQLPSIRASLGCARPRGKYRRELDRLAVMAGINSLALPSDSALEDAQSRGLELDYHEYCCSLG
jgi:lipoyl synthase